MNMIKVFTINSDGKIEFTKDELENLLNEVWEDGRNSAPLYWGTSPTVTPYYTTDKTVEITTCGSGK